VPAGAGVREDVVRLFEEIEEAQSNLGQIEALLNIMPDSKMPGYSKSIFACVFIYSKY